MSSGLNKVFGFILSINLMKSFVVFISVLDKSVYKLKVTPENLLVCIFI